MWLTADPPPLRAEPFGPSRTQTICPTLVEFAVEFAPSAVWNPALRF